MDDDRCGELFQDWRRNRREAKAGQKEEKSGGPNDRPSPQVDVDLTREEQPAIGSSVQGPSVEDLPRSPRHPNSATKENDPCAWLEGCEELQWEETGTSSRAVRTTEDKKVVQSLTPALPAGCLNQAALGPPEQIPSEHGKDRRAWFGIWENVVSEEVGTSSGAVQTTEDDRADVKEGAVILVMLTNGRRRENLPRDCKR